jgi:hypothetical protein
MRDPACDGAVEIDAHSQAQRARTIPACAEHEQPCGSSAHDSEPADAVRRRRREALLQHVCTVASAAREVTHHRVGG